MSIKKLVFLPGRVAGQLYLACGASLACDVPLLTAGGHARCWLANLLTSLMRQPKNYPLKFHPIVLRTLNLIACGVRIATVSWGNVSLQGKWVWRWKNVIVQHWMRLYKQ